MIPVMLFGVLFAKKKYSLREYMCVGLITVGIMTFNLAKASASNKEVMPKLDRGHPRMYLSVFHVPESDTHTSRVCTACPACVAFEGVSESPTRALR